MTDYDAVADLYDDHFHRRIDRWEDNRLASLLAPWVDGRNVLDLGCGTGWVLDHMTPGKYVGMDNSAPMLARLLEKHPDARVVKSSVGDQGYLNCVEFQWAHTIVATWAAHEFDLRKVLATAPLALRFNGILALHGQGPRYLHRSHYVLDGLDDHHGYLNWNPASNEAVLTRHFTYLGSWGTGAAPDWCRLRPAWQAIARMTPARNHYGILSAWRYTR